MKKYRLLIINIMKSYIIIKNKYLFLILILFFSGFLCFKLYTSKNAEPILKVVEVVTAKMQSIEETVRLIGTVRAKHTTVLMAKSTGILEILKQPGEIVTKGTLIARIINSDIEKRYEFAVATAQIAKEQYERVKLLSTTGVMSKQAAEEKQALLLEAERNLASAKIELDKIRFYAPFNGVIGVYKDRSGTEIKNEWPLVSFYDPATLVVDVNIPAPLLVSVNAGQKVVVNDKQYALTHVQKMLDDSIYMAPAVVDIATDNYIIGTLVDVELTIHQKNNTIVLPEEAIFLDQGKPHVYVIKNSKTILTPVKVGLRARENVEVTKGLVVGDIVVSQGLGRLSHNLKIKIYDPKEGQKQNVIKQVAREKLNELNRIFH